MTSVTSVPQPENDRRVDEWRAISEELLQGLVHALNNRVAALGAFVELAKLGDDEGDPLTVLPEEIAQLHRLNGLFGLLPERTSDPEPLEVGAVLEDAIRLHEHHPRLRAEQVSITFEGAPGAVRAPRWALLRALVMLVHLAKRAGESVRQRGGGALRVHGSETCIGVHVATVVQPSPDLVSLARRCGGDAVRESDELVLRLPSLRELRRREREARGETAN